MIIMLIFNMSTSYFHNNSFHYFDDYLMTKLTLGKVVRWHLWHKLYYFKKCLYFQEVIFSKIFFWGMENEESFEIFRNITIFN